MTNYPPLLEKRGVRGDLIDCGVVKLSDDSIEVFKIMLENVL